MARSPAHEQFWRWFQENGDHLRAIVFGEDENAREDALDDLRDRVAEVQEGLILEFDHADKNQTCPLIVSADGKPEYVDAVKQFVAEAPAIPGWRIVPFRPRSDMENSVIQIQGERVGMEDVWFEVNEDDDGLSLTLYVQGLTPENERMRGMGAILLAEHSVGERDSVTLLNSLSIEPHTEDTEGNGLRALPELAQVFDAAREQRYPAPGSLSIDEEGNWLAMQGAINDSVAFIMLNGGLRPMAGHPSYDRRLEVHIPFHEVTDDGLPETKEELIAVQDLGDLIADTLEEGQESLLGLTIVNQGKRELVFYTSNPEGAIQRLEALTSQPLSHDFGHELEWDSFWGKYRAFYEAGEESEEDEEE